MTKLGKETTTSSFGKRPPPSAVDDKNMPALRPRRRRRRIPAPLLKFREPFAASHEENRMVQKNKRQAATMSLREIPLVLRLRSIVVFLLISSSAFIASAMATETHPGAIPCTDQDGSNSICPVEVGPGSVCVNGLCSNPFVSGCLRTLLGHDPVKPFKNNNTKFANATEQAKQTQQQDHDFFVDPIRTLRACNSQDDPDTIQQGLCIPSPLDYMEIRILTGNWESSLLMAWALQILLSEWMQVPTSIESSSGDKASSNFYHPTNHFLYGISYDFQSLEVAHKVGDCRRLLLQDSSLRQEIQQALLKHDNLQTSTDNTDQGRDPYLSCAHVMPDVWNGQKETLWDLTQRRIIEAPEGNGVIGRLTWFIPKFVAEQQPELAHYAGWQNNRTLIASLFKRPVTWHEYCQNIAETKCEEPDDYATRPPLSYEERELYFDDASNGEAFRGYFHATDENDCNNFPNNCTGHFVDFPCDWSSFAIPQAYHLGIPISSSGKIGPSKGYSYGQKLQIWRAANATKSHVVMNWYHPDPTYQWYRGTEAEFQEVQLPPPSPQCVLQRVTEEQRCSDDFTDRVGTAEGACGAEIQTLEKAVVQNLYSVIYNPQNYLVNGLDPQMRHVKRGGTRSSATDTLKGIIGQEERDAMRSPAYEAIKNFHMSEFDVGKMFEDWRDRLRSRGHFGFSTFEGSTGADPRNVICSWVAENAEHLRSFVPFTYPRILDEFDPHENAAAFYIAAAFAGFVSLCIIMMGVVIFVLRREAAISAAQLPFLYLVLCGLLLVSCGGIFYALKPEDGICVARNWLTTFGYTLELVPLIVKIGAIGAMLQAAKRMRRVTIRRKKLFGAVGGVCVLITAFLLAWTFVDPPMKKRYLTLELDNGETGETANKAWWQAPSTPVTVSYYCHSESSAWETVSIIWQCFLLLGAAVLAIQTRQVQQRWNESRSLAMMVYSQAGFVVLRFLIWMVEGQSGVSLHTLDAFRSFIFSFDPLIAMLIYFGSKLVKVYNSHHGAEGSQTRGSSYGQSYMANAQGLPLGPDGRFRLPSGISGLEASSPSLVSGTSEHRLFGVENGNKLSIRKAVMPDLSSSNDSSQDEEIAESQAEAKEHTTRASANSDIEATVEASSLKHASVDRKRDATTSTEDLGSQGSR